MQVVNPQLRAERTAAPAVRTVTVLGATGSVGTSTVDLLKRGNGKYRVEAVTAQQECRGSWRRSRASSTRALRSWPIRRPMASSRTRLSGTGIEAASGEAAVIEAAERPADWVMAAVSGCGRTEAHARRGQARRDRRARQQGMPGLRRRRVHAHRCRRRRERAAGRFRAQRDLPGADRRAARGRQPHRDHRVRRSVPHLDARSDAGGHARAGAQASELVDGPEDHHRFRDHDEQGAWN